MNYVLKFELRRNTNRLTLIIFILFVLFGILIHQVGIERYKKAVAQQSYFLEIEKANVNKYRNNFEYGLLGFRIMSEPGKLYSLFFNSSTFGDLIGYITISYKLELTKPQIGKNSSDKPIGSVFDYSWYIMLIGCIIALLYGWNSLRNEGYLKFLLNFARPGTVYFTVLIGRFILLIAIFLSMILIALIQILINGLLSIELIKELLLFLLTLIVFVFTIFLFSTINGETQEYKSRTWFNGTFFNRDIIYMAGDSKFNLLTKST